MSHKICAPSISELLLADHVKTPCVLIYHPQTSIRQEKTIKNAKHPPNVKMKTKHVHKIQVNNVKY